MGSLPLKLQVSINCLALAAPLVSQAADAQEIILSPAPEKPPPFQITDDWSPEERKFFWGRTSVDPEGFLRIAGTEDQVNVINEARRFVRKKIEPGYESIVSAITQAGFPHVGTWKEDKYRVTMIFGDSSVGLLMYTKSQFEKAGHSVTVIKDFVRFKIKNSPAVLTLTTTPTGKKALWKVGTWREGVSHEIYVEEELTQGRKPKRSAQQILRLAESIIE